MSEEIKSGEPLQSRELLKGKKLEYLYQCDDPTVSMYPLLGSAVRALGKGWKVRILASAGHAPVFEGLNQLLQDQSLMSFEASQARSRRTALIVEANVADYSLTLIDGTRRNSPVKPIRDSMLGKTHIMVAGKDSSAEDYDLISNYQIQNLHTNGVIAITGTGKGKSTTGFGIAADHAARGEKVAVVQWFKEAKKEKGTWSINEHFFPDVLQQPDNFVFYPTGLGFFGSPTLDRVKGDNAYQKHRQNAQQGVILAKQMIESGQYGVVVLDELVDTLVEVSNNIPKSLLDVAEVRDLLAYSKQYPKVTLVVTGRKVTPEWEDLVKQSIVIQEVRHPWSSKQKSATSGLDF